MKFEGWTILILFILFAFFLGLALGDETIEKVYRTEVAYIETIYINQTDTCIQEVFDVIDNGKAMERKIYEYINYK